MPHRTLRRYFRHGTLTQLIVFEAAARHSSVTRAAEEMHLAQPTVSVQLKKLADTIGLPLFEQVGRKLHLTDAGQVLAEACGELFTVLERTEDRLAALRRPDHGPLRIAVSAAARHALAEPLARFCRQHPQVQARIEMLNRAQLRARMAANEDDLYVLCEPEAHETLTAHPLFEDHLLVAVAVTHRWARRGGATLAELAAEPLLLREPGSGTRARVDRLFALHGLAPTPRLELGSDEAIADAARQGLGAAVVPARCLAEPAGGLPLTALEVPGFPLARRWSLVYPSGKRLSPTTRRFRDELLSMMREAPGARRAPEPARFAM